MKKLFPAIAQDIDRGNYNYAHAIYVDNDCKDCIDGNVLVTVEEGTFKQSTKFRSYIEINKPKCFMDLLILIEFNWLGIERAQEFQKDFKSPSFRAVPIVDELLKESNGFLLWDYQIIKLYSLFNGEMEKAVSFQKNYNQKRIEFEDVAEKLLFNNGITLADVIYERSILGLAKKPKLKGAYNLYKLLFE